MTNRYCDECHEELADDGTCSTHDIPADSAYDKAIAYATERGAKDGASAATWYVFDAGPWHGPDQTTLNARAVLRGIENGDPAVLDRFPAADLSGQWADSLTGPALAHDAVVEAGVPLDDEHEQAEQDWFDVICTAYEAAYNTAVEGAIAAAARAILAD